MWICFCTQCWLLIFSSSARFFRPRSSARPSSPPSSSASSSSGVRVYMCVWVFICSITFFNFIFAVYSVRSPSSPSSTLLVLVLLLLLLFFFFHHLLLYFSVSSVLFAFLTSYLIFLVFFSLFLCLFILTFWCNLSWNDAADRYKFLKKLSRSLFKGCYLFSFLLFVFYLQKSIRLDKKRRRKKRTINFKTG